MLDVQNIYQLFQPKAKIVLIGHHNPDGDAVGSLIAMGEFLETKGCLVTRIVPNAPASFLSQMIGFEKIFSFKEHSKPLTQKVSEADTIVFLDFNDIDTRIGKLSDVVLKNTDAQRVLIDHHLAPKVELFDIVFSDTDYSSTALLVFDIIQSLQGVDLLNQAALEAIYVGMLTDTGNFSYGNLTPSLFRALARLVERGVQPTKIHAMISYVKSEGNLRLNAYALYRKMVLVDEKTAYISLNKKEMNRFSYRPGDLDGLVNAPLSIKGITFSALFIETDECIKISFRSRGDQAVDVNEFARRYFVGGGHRNAAGAKSFTSMAPTVRRFINIVRRHRDVAK